MASSNSGSQKAKSLPPDKKLKESSTSAHVSEVLKRPSVFKYRDFRDFLKDYLNFKASEKSSYTARSFSTRTFNHPGLLWEILKGRRKLSVDNEAKLLATLKLPPNESEYLETLIRFNQLPDESQSFYKEKLDRLQSVHAQKLSETQKKYWFNWRYAILFNLIGFVHHQKAASKLVQNYLPGWDVKGVEKMLKDLVEMGLIRKTANGYIKAEKHIQAGGEYDEAAARSFSGQFMQQASNYLEEKGFDLACFATQVFAVDKDGYERLHQLIGEFAEKIKKWADTVESGERVFTLNVQLFPNTAASPEIKHSKKENA